MGLQGGAVRSGEGRQEMGGLHRCQQIRLQGPRQHLCPWGGSPHTGAQPGSSPWPTSPQTRSCSRCLEQKASGARGKIPAHPKAPALPEAIPGSVSMDSVLQEGHKGDIFLCSHQPAWTVFYSSRTSDPASRRQGRLWPDTPIPMALPPSVLNTNP